ncbi:hypothetical protein P8452_16135 [Trifolium repens]|nr:hypothetical protein P8452_16135 [Trifolium repens]
MDASPKLPHQNDVQNSNTLPPSPPPYFLSILAYFWPLFASTTVFLVAIIAFGGVSKFSTETHGEKAGEGLLDYVAGKQEHIQEAQHF